MLHGENPTVGTRGMMVVVNMYVVTLRYTLHRSETQHLQSPQFNKENHNV